MADASKAKPLKRSIYFYRVLPDDPSKPVQLSTLVQQVDALPWSAGTRRYWAQPSGDDIALWNHHSDGERFVLASNRRGGFPRSENGGSLSDLTLGAGSGLHEAVHVRVFELGIVGFEFNFYGPRPSRLPLYMKHALPVSNGFSLEALLRNDVLARLDQQKELRVVDLQIRRGYADQVAKANKKLGDALKQLSGASDAEVIGVMLRPDYQARTPLGSKVIKQMKKIAKLDGIREHAVVFKVKGVNSSSGSIDSLDLLSDHLVSRKSMVRQGTSSNAVDSESAFAAIEDAYNDLRAELIEASGVRTSTPSSGDGAG